MSNNFAVLQVLAFLGAIALLACLTIGALVARFAGRGALARRLLVGAGLLLGGYGLALAIAGAASGDKVLARGEEKYFCEIDCHLANSITAIERDDSIGSLKPAGQFYLVTVRTWFDPTTTSPTRPRDAVVYPNPRVIYLVDQSGRRFAPSLAGMAELARSGRAGTPITQPLPPDASYTTTFAFEVPAGLVSPKLWLAEGDGVAPFIIGHERSWLHGRTLFAL